MLKDFEDIFS